MINLVANELKQVGFQVKVIGQAVEVSLSNRKPGKMEVEIALEKIFDGIQFDCKSNNQAVVVSL